MCVYLIIFTYMITSLVIILLLKDISSCIVFLSLFDAYFIYCIFLWCICIYVFIYLCIFVLLYFKLACYLVPVADW